MCDTFITSLDFGKMAALNKYLKSIYFDPTKPSSFTSPEKLYSYVKKEGKYDVSKYRIRKWLDQQEPYSLQKINRKPKTTPIIVSGIDDQWSADLMDMAKFSDKNNGVKYILVAIDTFSKYLYLRPLMDKTGKSVAAAFQDIFKHGRVPNRLRTDKGQEFKARVVRDLMEQNNVKQLFAENETKAAISECVIKTIKARIYRFLMHENSHVYMPELQNFAKSYNNTVHSTIGTEPSSVSKANEDEVRLAEVNYLGLLRLAQAFGPAMASRAADGVRAAAAWVNILSAGALATEAGFGRFTASHAAARALSLSMRAEFRASGLRVLNVYVGPEDDAWRQTTPPPKVAPAALARDVARGLIEGLCPLMQGMTFGFKNM